MSKFIGVDEAGRGCLCGPVVAAAVCWNPEHDHPWITDSKKLTSKRRQEMVPYIKKNAFAYGIGVATHDEIDQYNILQATYLAMHRALDEIKCVSEEHTILVDGNRFKKYGNINHQCVVKGDSIHPCISAASILAKEYRDDWIDNYVSTNCPSDPYHWKSNKGYGTKPHIQAIREFGQSDIHRTTFYVKTLCDDY